MSRDSEFKTSRSQDFWRAVRFLGPYRGLVTRSMVSAIIAGSLMTAGLPLMVPFLKVLMEGKTVQRWAQESLDSAGPNPPQRLQYLSKIASWMPEDRVQTVGVLFLTIALIALVGNVVRYIYEFSSDKAVINAVNDIRRKLYDHILHLPLEFFGLKGTSDVTSRLVSDCMDLQAGLKICLGQSVLDIVRAALAISVAVFIDWRLTIFIIIFIPLMGAVIKKFGKKMRRASRAAMQNNASMLGQIDGSLTGIRVVKAANAERFERRRYVKVMEQLRHQQLKMARYDALSTPIMETFATWGGGAILIFATYLMWGENVTKPLNPYWFLVFMTCILVIGESVRKLSKLNSVLQRSHSAAARIFETLDIPVERPRRLSAGQSSTDRLVNLPPIERDVRFESVTFAYPNSSLPAVSDVELVVPKGKSVAIVGRNGSGKTTLLAMLPRFYDPNRGRITIDGMDIRKTTLRSLRRQITIVTQDSVIFPGTVAENIAYGHPLATLLIKDNPASQALRKQIESAARRAFAHDFIMEKPGGYDAMLDGLGGQLSGGQRQRLNIARAILRQSPILILDEATSQVDAESEHLIQQAIESLMHERTTFVIAHRFSTILSADSIVVMDRGRIVGQGQHDELLKTCETYQQLYERQLIASPA